MYSLPLKKQQKGGIYCLYLFKKKKNPKIIIYVCDFQKMINGSNVCCAISFQSILAVFIYLFWNHQRSPALFLPYSNQN